MTDRHRSLNRHVVQVASYLRYGYPDAEALREVGIDARFSPTYQRQVLDEAGDWNIQLRASGQWEPDPGVPYVP